ncbi:MULTISPECIES: acyltransferase [Catenuloplanes]|uniref:Peptidoglycan/LPS O-acetylase OafA/YrhL n=1 Tax=Catenuloplanes niger TaxID=587534 RepID=A0AAE4CZ68_9ACTN|nr:acyltransferase family protein [Catenuloplanes niger]MDR7328303.1 peptidoglycan/LPS O-acetylase OafA/YrhL [Catenuloplanes niger]
MTEQSAERDRLYELDGLRIFAAVAVMFYHYAWANAAGPEPHTATGYPELGGLFQYGYLGVDLFFTISGFVILLSAMGRRPAEFVISRVVRLYPAYWVALTITAIVLATIGAGQFPISIVQYVANLTMFNSLVNIPNVDVVYWTLWAEMRFYVMILIFTMIGITKNRVLVFLWGWTAISLLLAANVLPGPIQTVATLVFQPEWSQYFIAGMALSLLYRFGRTWQPFALLAVSAAIAVVRAIDFKNAVGERYQESFSTAVVVVIVLLVFVVMTLTALRITRGLGRAWFAVAGSLTYPLYLIHDRVGVVLWNRLDDYVNRWVLLLAVPLLMCGVAWLIHRYVERPGAKALKRGLTALAARFGLVTPRGARSAKPDEEPAISGAGTPDKARAVGVVHVPQPTPPGRTATAGQPEPEPQPRFGGGYGPADAPYPQPAAGTAYGRPTAGTAHPQTGGTGYPEPTGGAGYLQQTGATYPQQTGGAGYLQQTGATYPQQTGGAGYPQQTGATYPQQTGGAGYSEPTGGAYSQPAGDVPYQPQAGGAAYQPPGGGDGYRPPAGGTAQQPADGYPRRPAADRHDPYQQPGADPYHQPVADPYHQPGYGRPYQPPMDETPDERRQ